LCEEAGVKILTLRAGNWQINRNHLKFSAHYKTIGLN
jgi:hypothetical protein